MSDEHRQKADVRYQISERKSEAMSSDSKDVAKQFLLAEYERFSEAFWKNEQIGETRVNWFLGIVTAALAGLAALLTKAEGNFVQQHLQAILLVGLTALLVFGVGTFARMIIRNERTDQYKHALDVIRQKFQDYFAGDEILLDYYPQGGPWKKKRPKRKFGGLVHNVAAMNALIIALGTGAALSQTYKDHAALYQIPVLALIIGFGAQYWVAYWLEERAKRRIYANDTTHAGGVVFQVNQSGAAEYLVIHPNLPQTPEEKKKKAPKKVDVTKRVFPKGHIERGESHVDAALREVREEAGVIARIVCPLGMVTYKLKDETDPKEKELRVKFYLMETLAKRTLEEAEAKRDPQFMEYARAQKELTHDESREMLELAERKGKKSSNG